MQEEVTQRTVALCVEASKLSAGMLQQAMKKVLDEMQKGVTSHKTKLHHGKQTLRQLMKHNTGVSNIEITDQNIRAFSATAKTESKTAQAEIRRTRKQNFSPRYAADRCVCCWAALPKWEQGPTSRRCS